MTIGRHPYKIFGTIDLRLRKSIPIGRRLFYDVMDVETGTRFGHCLATVIPERDASAASGSYPGPIP